MRFSGQKIYKCENLDILDKFVGEILNGEGEIWYPSLKDKKEKHSVKLVGTDFENRVFNSSKDAMVLFYHPLTQKNRGLKERYEHFVKFSKSGDTESNLVFCRFNGVNESEVYRPPSKLPALVYFKSQPDGSFKEIIEYPETRNHMLKTSTNEQFKKAM